jgi:hypothetical protein
MANVSRRRFRRQNQRRRSRTLNRFMARGPFSLEIRNEERGYLIHRFTSWKEIRGMSNVF